MTHSKKIFLILIVILTSNCNKKQEVIEKNTESSKSKKVNKEYDELNRYFAERNLDLCLFKNAIDSINFEANAIANDKFPDKLSKHAKFVERHIEQNRRIYLLRNTIADSIFFEAYQIAEAYCK